MERNINFNTRNYIFRNNITIINDIIKQYNIKNNYIMDLNKAIKLLKYHSKWIKGDINCIDELNSFDLLKAIEIIIKEINMNKEKELDNTPQVLGGVKELVDDVIMQIKEDLETDNIEAIEGLLYLLCSKNNIKHMIEYLCCEESTKKYDKINTIK